MIEMKQEKKINLNVPNLRFPEFTDDWDYIPVSKLLDFYSTNSLSWENLEYKNKGVYNIHYGLIHKELPVLVDISKHFLPTIKSESIPNNYVVSQNGDLAFADASEDTNDVAKAIELINCDNEIVVCGLHTIHGRDNTDLTIVGYKGYVFASSKFHNQVRKIAQGTKVYSISTKNLNECYIGIPHKKEQKKITSLLSLLDERILTQMKIIEDLKEAKSAIVERLFVDPQCDYKVVTLGDITKNFSVRNTNNDPISVYSVTNDTGFMKQSEKFENREIAGEDTSTYKIIHQGEFAYNPARINVGSIARYNELSPCIISSLYVCFKPAKDVFSNWLLYLLKSKRIMYYYNVFGEGGVRLYLFYPNFSRIKIKLTSYKEQVKVANLISSIDSKLLLETSLLNSYTQQKQYLLSQMFI